MDPGIVTAAATTISTLAAAVSAYTSYKSIVTSAKSSADNIAAFEAAQNGARQSSNLSRLIQAVIHCNQRYHDLEAERSEIVLNSSFSVNSFRKFSTRYWSLKSDQFDYWLAGFIDPDAFTTWFSSVAKHFASAENYFGTFNYRDGWIVYGREYHREVNPWFVTFVDAIENCYKTPTDIDQGFGKLIEIIEIMEGSRERPGVTRRFRTKFQAGLDFEDYREMAEDMELVKALRNKLPGIYSASNQHSAFHDAQLRIQTLAFSE